MADNIQARNEQFVKYQSLFYPANMTQAQATAERSKTLSRVIVTISDYSDKGCLTKIAHTITQVFRQIISIILTILTFGTFRWGTEWQVTRREATKLVKADLKEQIAQGIKQLDAGSEFVQKIEREIVEKNLTEDAQKDAYREKRRNEIAEAAVKRIDVSGYTNDLMLDILEINKAKNKVDKGIHIPDERALTKLILLRESTTIAQALVDKTADKNATKEIKEAAAKKAENFRAAANTPFDETPFDEISLVLSQPALKTDYEAKNTEALAKESVATTKAGELTAKEAAGIGKQMELDTEIADANDATRVAALNAELAAIRADILTLTTARDLANTEAASARAAADAAKASMEAADKLIDAAKKPAK